MARYPDPNSGTRNHTDSTGSAASNGTGGTPQQKRRLNLDDFQPQKYGSDDPMYQSLGARSFEKYAFYYKALISSMVKGDLTDNPLFASREKVKVGTSDEDTQVGFHTAKVSGETMRLSPSQIAFLVKMNNEDVGMRKASERESGPFTDADIINAYASAHNEAANENDPKKKKEIKIKFLLGQDLLAYNRHRQQPFTKEDFDACCKLFLLVPADRLLAVDRVIARAFIADRFTDLLTELTKQIGKNHNQEAKSMPFIGHARLSMDSFLRELDKGKVDRNQEEGPTVVKGDKPLFERPKKQNGFVTLAKTVGFFIPLEVVGQLAFYKFAGDYTPWPLGIPVGEIFCAYVAYKMAKSNGEQKGARKKAGTND